MRFDATVLEHRPNPYVDVPRAVSQAFAERAVAGKIRFEGTLNGAPIRGTLMPVAGGGHRLYLNGGMRSAARVAVGDTVSLEVTAVGPETVNPPADVVAGLRQIGGAEAAFGALSPARRRELLRYIDDARTSATRQRRIATTAEHVLGSTTRPPAARARSDRPLWTCPKCGSSFVIPNQYHSCHRYEIADAFQGKPAQIRELFERFRAMVEACGPVTPVAYRDRIAFMVRVRFLGAVPRMRWLDLELWLTRRVEHPRFHKVETIYPNVHIHSLRISRVEDLDDEVAAWVQEAYAIGRQEHLR